MDKKEQIHTDIMRLKSVAYDLLANLEYIHNDYKSKVTDLQKQLEDANKHISSKDQELRILLQEDTNKDRVLLQENDGE